jgi:hypothetical protein
MISTAAPTAGSFLHKSSRSFPLRLRERTTAVEERVDSGSFVVILEAMKKRHPGMAEASKGAGLFSGCHSSEKLRSEGCDINRGEPDSLMIDLTYYPCYHEL